MPSGSPPGVSSGAPASASDSVGASTSGVEDAVNVSTLTLASTASAAATSSGAARKRLQLPGEFDIAVLHMSGIVPASRRVIMIRLRRCVIYMRLGKGQTRKAAVMDRTGQRII
jgi:hypothetical protein